MQLLAIAGGAPPGEEDWCSCCGMFVVLPLVVFLAGRAVIRNSGWFALAALLLAGVPYLLLRSMVDGYQPSNDGDVRADQKTSRQALGFYLWLVVAAGSSFLWVVLRRLTDWDCNSADLSDTADSDA